MSNPSPSLRELAKAATPGPWHEAPPQGPDYDYSPICCGDEIIIKVMYTGDGVETSARAAFIAAASPEVVTALLDRLEALENVLLTISSFAVGNGDVCEIIASRARAVLAPHLKD